ncbi:MAG: hypothetical protein AB7V18_19310 [Pyrinomonadaceae bacterium]
MTPDSFLTQLEKEIDLALDCVLGPRGRDQVKADIVRRITPVVNDLAFFNFQSGKREGYAAGERDERSRARVKPGQGDMGG